MTYLETGYNATMKNLRPAHWLFIGLLLFFVIGSYVAIYHNLTQGSTDLFPRWKGAEVYFNDGTSPYADEVGLASQQQIYGRPAEPDEDQVLYAYPFYTVFYIGPLAFVSYQVAAAVYMEIMLLGLLLSAGLILHQLRWLPPPGVLVILLLFTLIGYFSARGIILAQLALLAYAAHVVALWGIWRGYDTLAGLALVISTIKPQTGYLIVPLLLIWAFRMRRWWIPISFTVAFGFLMGISFILEPTWFADWMGQVFDYGEYTETVAAAHILTHFIEPLPELAKDLAQVIFSSILLFPVIVFWKRNLVDNDPQNFLWGYALTMLVSLMIAPRVATTYYVELYPVLYVTAYILWQQGRTGWIMVGGLVLLIGYWVLHIATVPPAGPGGAGLEAPIVYVVFPLLILAMLYYYRDQWPQIYAERTD